MPKIAKDKDSTKPKPRAKKANGYKFPEKLPQGEILKDTAKKEWKLGTSIGQGGFGEIYCASAVGEKSSVNDPYVIKIEPHENGPLFVEKNFYIKVARPDDVNAWKNSKGIKVLGMPTLHGSGSHVYKNEKYRFIVIDRFGKDLWNLFLNHKKKFSAASVFKCAIQIIDVLNYIHDKGYVHGDIKGANLLLGLQKGTEHNVFLVDFGLACKYNTKEFQKDPKKAHNGTIEYTSRDMHIGVPTRRGDMEILGYNLLHWLGSTLPWEKDINNPEKVYEKKKNLMEHAKDFIKKEYPQVPKVMTSYLEYVFNLKHDQAPDYNFCKELFLKELKTLPGNTNGKLDFGAKDVESRERSLSPKKTPRGKRRSVMTEEASLSHCSSEDMFANTPTPKKARSKVPMKDTPVKEKPSPRPRAKKETEPKATWRDAPTAQASRVTRAGEYVKQNTPVQRRSKK